MIPDSTLDFASDLFDPHKALYSIKVSLPYPKAKTYNNLAEYYSHTFLKKGFESDRPPKKQIITRERNYEWYYDTLGLTEYQRSRLRRNKKIRRRKGKKPISIVTIPGSPLKSERITVCKSNFKEYCRRKYKSLSNIYANNTKSEEAETFLLPITSESSSVSSALRNELSCPPSSLPFIPCKTPEFQPSSISVSDNKRPSSLPDIIKSKPSESLITSQFVKTESSILSSEYSNDSFMDDVLIRKMNSNVQKIPLLKDTHKLHVPLEMKDGLLKSTNNKHSLVDLKYTSEPLQKTNDRKLDEINFSGQSKCPNVSSDHLLNSDCNLKSSNALNNLEKASLMQMKCTGGLEQSKKINKSDKSKLKLQKSCENSKHKKKKKHCEKSVLNSDLLQKSPTDKISSRKQCVGYKENLRSVNNSKSDIQFIKKHKSTLKSQESVSNSKKISTKAKIGSKSNKKKVNSPVIDHCICKLPCGLSPLCSCGYYVRAKEKLSKFKIPRIKK